LSFGSNSSHRHKPTPLNPGRHSALTATRWNSTIKTFYQRRLAKGKPPKVALTAAMRKLLTILNPLVKSNQ